jgi:hypothetical protein
MFDRMKEIELSLDTSMAPKDRTKFFDSEKNLRHWLRETEAWCRSVNRARENLGDRHQMYMIWIDGQYLW